MDRRTHPMPFAVTNCLITTANNQRVALAETSELAAFLCLAANRYDNLMALFDLCRGENENFTLPYRTPTHKAIAELTKQLHDEILRNGR